MCPKFEGMAWSLAQMAPLNVRPPVLPPCSHSRATRSCGRRSKPDTHGLRVLRTCVSKGTVRSWICAIVSSCSPCSQGARASDRHAQMR